MRLSAINALAVSFCTFVAILSTRIPAIAADTGQTALNADHRLSRALGNKDKDAISALLDAKFTFTDTDGKIHSKSDVLTDPAGLASMNGDESDVQTHFYGTVETVLGSHHGARFLHIWVKRPSGWKAFVALDTVVTPAPQASVEKAAGNGDCDNPCRTVPYTPSTRMDKEILATWQKTKMEEWHYDAAGWDKDIGEEFLIINNTTMRDKPARMVIAKKQQADKVGAPGDPIVKMQIFDFGPAAAVMVSDHVPYRGGKPYHNVRVVVRRDGRWQLVISQQTNVKDAAAVPAVAASK
ncbi:MAG: nuclear transport factor 2 family protein [Xanthobacteraceae bacterium]|jgi:hypothetical protein